MHLISTSRAIVAFFKVLYNAALTKCVQTFCNSGRLDDVSLADVAGDVRVELVHKVSLLCGHWQERKKGVHHL